MAERTGRVTRTYTDEYRKGAVKLAREVGRNKAAAELGISENTLNGWLMKARAGEIDLGAGSRTPTESMTLAAELKAAKEEVKRLTKEIGRQKETIDFLTEATAFFAASRRK